MSIQMLYGQDVKISATEGSGQSPEQWLVRYFDQYRSDDASMVRRRVNETAFDFIVSWGRCFWPEQDDEATEILAPMLPVVARSHRCCLDSRKARPHWIVRDWAIRRCAPAFLSLSDDTKAAAESLRQLPPIVRRGAYESFTRALDAIPVGLREHQPEVARRTPLLRSGMYSAAWVSADKNLMQLVVACANIAKSVDQSTVELIVKAAQKSARTMIVRLCDARLCEAHASKVYLDEWRGE